MAIGEKGQSTLWLNPRMLVGLALCLSGTLGKGTLRTYPSFRVPTDGVEHGYDHRGKVHTSRQVDIA